MTNIEKNASEYPYNCTSTTCHYRKDIKNEFSLMIATFNQVLRDPISLMYSTLQLMEEQTPEVMGLKYWCQLKDDMKDVIGCLNQFDAYEDGREADLCEMNLLTLLQEGVGSIQATTKTCDIDFKITCDDASKREVCNYLCDSIKLKAAFMEIIQFLARTMTDTKVVHINIHANRNELCRNIDGNTYMIISFSGDGNALTDEMISSLFDLFRINQKNQSNVSLAVTKGLVEAHGGQIQLNSKKNETSFTVLLPLID